MKTAKVPSEKEQAKTERRRAKLLMPKSRSSLQIPMVWVKRCRKSLSDSGNYSFSEAVRCPQDQ